MATSSATERCCCGATIAAQESTGTNIPPSGPAYRLKEFRTAHESCRKAWATSLAAPPADAESAS